MTRSDHTLRHHRVLVTGATGFIGGRLARRLDLEHDAEVTGSGRRTDPIPILQGTDVKLALADLCEHKKLAQLVAGKNIVFHVAAWLGDSNDSSSKELAEAVNVTATEALVKACAKAGVRRVVLVSSIAAYGPPDDGPIPETTPIKTSQPDYVYGETKARGEQRALELAAELGLELTVVRPGMVYGPGSMSWTRGMFNLVNKGVPVLFGKSDGHISPVYVDDLIDQMVAMAVSKNAPGQVFNGVGPSPVTWRTWFEAYGALAGKKPRGLPMFLAKVVALAAETFPLGLPLDRSKLKFYKAKPHYSMDKAKDLLGFEPQFELDQGMHHCEAWLREEGYLKGG